MATTLTDKLNRAREKELTKLSARFAEAPNSTDGYFVPGLALEKFEDGLKNLRSAPGNKKHLAMFLAGPAWTGEMIPLTHQAMAFARADATALELSFAFQMSRDYILRQLKIATGRPVMFEYEHMRLVLGLYAIGWCAEADATERSIWEHPKAPLVRAFMPARLMTWFTSYFALGSRDLIAATELEPPQGEPDEPDSPYSLLLGCWKDSDPAKVSNSLIAFSEQNIARSLLPESKRESCGFDTTSWWYVPWDVLAINMRRGSLGLAWVETDDPRMLEVWQNREELPFVKDDIIWPAYLEVCDLLKLEPYQPRKSIDVKVDRRTFALEPLG